MTQYWSRNDTKYWVAQLENRIEDLEFYLRRTLEWCEEREVFNDRIIFACCIMSLVWVSYLRNEPISKMELFEILGVEGWEDAEDEIFEFNPKYAEMELEELLDHVVSSFY